MKWWPFKKKTRVEYIDPGELNFTQVDFTEFFDQHLELSPQEWTETAPMNKVLKDLGNLPPLNATDDEVFRIASELSAIRERFQVHDDGVYCPICHIANVDISNLRKPCPKCARPLLAFGWR
jgi:hypothetical protein